ncbi:MAG: hypothetical protein AABY49_09005 [Planctomycetota bacterium]
MQDKYEILKQRKGHNTAKVALAREMLKIIYHVLKEQRPFYFSNKKYQIQPICAVSTADRRTRTGRRSLHSKRNQSNPVQQFGNASCLMAVLCCQTG